MTESDARSGFTWWGRLTYLGQAVCFGLAYFAAAFAIDAFVDEPFSWSASAGKNWFVAVFFGLLMPWAMRLVRRRRS